MYQPYAIYDFRSGKIEGLEPWKIPQDAFKKLRNGRLKIGVLEKRPGHTELGWLMSEGARAYGAGVYGDGTYGGAAAARLPVMGLFNYYSTNRSYDLLAVDTRRLNIYDNTNEIFTDLMRYKIHFKPGASQNYTPTVGDVIEGATSGAYATVEAITIDKGTIAGGNANGWLIFELGTIYDSPFVTGENLRDKSNPTDIVGDSDGTQVLNEFTGNDDDFFRFCNWQDFGYFTNSVDQIQRYNNTVGFPTPFQIDLDVTGGPDNDVNTCRLIFVVKNRIVILYTMEKGVRYPKRARYSNVNSTSFDAAMYKDAPIDDEIISACMIGDILYVWFKERTMKLAYTGDDTDPFKWINVDDSRGCYAGMSMVKCGSEAILLGKSKLLVFNQQVNYEINEKIPDFILDVMPTAINYSYGIDLPEDNTILLSYVSLDSADGKPDSILVYNYKDKSYATWEMPAHVFGWYSNSSEDNISLDDYADGVSTDDMVGSLDDVNLQGGYPKVLMGCRDGCVYVLNDGSSDNGSNIPFEAEGGEWNPFVKDGFKARFGYVDFMVDNNGAVFDITLSLNAGQAAYKTQTVTCTNGDATKQKIWKRVKAGAVAESHILNLSNNNKTIRPRIHAIVPYFERGGRIL